MRIQTFELDPMQIPQIAMSYQQKNDIVRGYAERYVSSGKYHESLRDAADQTALDCKDIDTPSEIKKLFRSYVRQLTR